VDREVNEEGEEKKKAKKGSTLKYSRGLSRRHPPSVIFLFEHTPYSIDHLVSGYRLREKKGRPFSQDAFLGGGIAQAGINNDQHIAKATDLAADLPSVYDGHHQVKYDRIGLCLAQKFDPFRTTFGSDHLEFTLEQPAPHVENVRVVIDDKYLGWHPFRFFPVMDIDLAVLKKMEPVFKYGIT